MIDRRTDQGKNNVPALESAGKINDMFTVIT